MAILFSKVSWNLERAETWKWLWDHHIKNVKEELDISAIVKTRILLKPARVLLRLASVMWTQIHLNMDPITIPPLARKAIKHRSEGKAYKIWLLWLEFCFPCYTLSDLCTLSLSFFVCEKRIIILQLGKHPSRTHKACILPSCKVPSITLKTLGLWERGRCT